MIVHRGIYKELELNLPWGTISEENPVPQWTPLNHDGGMALLEGEAPYALLPMKITDKPLFTRAFVLVSGVLEVENDEDMSLLSGLVSKDGPEYGMAPSANNDGGAFFYFVGPGLLAGQNQELEPGPGFNPGTDGPSA